MSAPPATVLVVVVTYSPGEHLAELIRSLPNACTASYRVVLADNGSIDGAPERAVGEHGVELVRTGGNVGYGSAANVGAQGGREPFILVCNPDVTFRHGSIDELLAAARRWPRAGAFGPAIVTDGSLYPSARELPVIGHGVGHAVLARAWPSNPWSRAYRRHDSMNVERVAGWLSGSCLLIRRSAFEAVGGFDPRYFMYFEDVDLGDRLAREGFASVYVPQARVDHVGATSTSRDPISMLEVHHDSAYLYLRDRYSKPWHWLFRVGLGVRLRMLRRREKSRR